jgi:hypothetical protein
VHLVGFLFIIVIADARNHEPERLLYAQVLRWLNQVCTIFCFSTLKESWVILCTPFFSFYSSLRFSVSVLPLIISVLFLVSVCKILRLEFESINWRFYFLNSTVKFDNKNRLEIFYSCCKTLCSFYWTLYSNTVFFQIRFFTIWISERLFSFLKIFCCCSWS